MTDAEPGDLVVLYSIDRSVTDLMDYLKARQAFRSRKVGYWFIRESMGWKPGEEHNPFLEALEEVLVIFGKLETRIRRARQTAGIAAKRSPETGKCPWGGRRRGTRVRLSKEKEKAARDMLRQGKKISEIARLLGLTRQTIYRALGQWDRRKTSA
jgi:DNA invertase Pin-like site-specific DNA recombinase